MLIQYSTNYISKWLSEFGCLTKLSTELFNGMKVYSHLIYCPSQTKCVYFAKYRKRKYTCGTELNYCYHSVTFTYFSYTQLIRF